MAAVTAKGVIDGAAGRPTTRADVGATGGADDVEMAAVAASGMADEDRFADIATRPIVIVETGTRLRI